MSVLPSADRLALGALGLADVGVGLYLLGAAVPLGTGSVVSTVYAAVAVVVLLLAMPAVVAGATGRLPYGAATGVLVNVGVLTFTAAEVALATSNAWQAAGLAILVAAAAAGTGALYVSLFRRRGVEP